MRKVFLPAFIIILFFLSKEIHAQSDEQIKNSMLEWLEAGHGNLGTVLRADFFVKRSSVGLGQQFYAANVQNGTPYKIRVKGEFYARLVCGNETISKLDFVLQPYQSLDKAKMGDLATGYLSDATGLIYSSDKEECAGNAIMRNGKKYGVNRIKSVGMRNVVFEAEINSDGTWAKMKSDGTLVGPAANSVPDKTTQPSKNPGQSNKQNNGSTGYQNPAVNTANKANSQTRQQDDAANRAAQQKNLQARIDEQMRILSQKNESQARTMNAILDGLGSFFSSIQINKAKTRIANDERDRDREFDELKRRINNEGGELVDCSSCNGDGYRNCGGCRSSGKVTCGVCYGKAGETCVVCKGSGKYKVGAAEYSCSSCFGKGVKTCSYCDNTGKTPCISCNGLGKIQCSYCTGTGLRFTKSDNTTYIEQNNISSPQPTENNNQYVQNTGQSNDNDLKNPVYLTRMGFQFLSFKQVTEGIYYLSEAVTHSIEGADTALVNIGNVYYTNKYGLKNDTMAYSYFHQAIMYNPGNEEAMAKLQEGIQKNNSLALATMGLAYSQGNGVVQDFKKAKLYFQKLVAQNNPIGYAYLADHYMNQEINKTEALKCLNKAVEYKNSWAAQSLGNIYSGVTPISLGIPKDFKEAFKWYTLAYSFDSTDMISVTRIGELYENGQGIAQDYKKAMSWYLISAKHNEQTAIYNIGRMYDKGLGVEKNLIEAFKWYKRLKYSPSDEATKRLDELGIKFE